MWPELVRKLVVWSIVGGTYSTMTLAGVYVLNELRTVRSKGIEGVLEMSTGPGSWAALIAANPRNRDRLLAIGSEEFERVMNRWLNAYVPKPNEAIPGVSDWEFEGINVPTLIIRGGAKDYDHPPRTSMEIHSLIEGSVLVDPPWPEDAWETASAATAAGKGHLFDPWVLGAPVMLEFMND
jgi:2-hydroxy-6-oxonona-2,4-dienedioate hydrolase